MRNFTTEVALFTYSIVTMSAAASAQTAIKRRSIRRLKAGII
jgi:hypothetical protein